MIKLQGSASIRGRYGIGSAHRKCVRTSCVYISHAHSTMVELHFLLVHLPLVSSVCSCVCWGGESGDILRMVTTRIHSIT